MDSTILYASPEASGSSSGAPGARTGALGLSELGTASAIKRDFESYLAHPGGGVGTASQRSSTLTADLEAHVVQALRQNEEVSHELEALLKEVSTPVKGRAPASPQHPPSSAKRALAPAMAAAGPPAGPPRSPVQAASAAVARAHADAAALRTAAAGEDDTEEEAASDDAELVRSSHVEAAIRMAEARYGSPPGGRVGEARVPPRVPPSPLRDHFTNISSFLAESTSSRREHDATLLSSMSAIASHSPPRTAYLSTLSAKLPTPVFTPEAGQSVLAGPRVFELSPSLSPSPPRRSAPAASPARSPGDAGIDWDAVNAALLKAGFEPLPRRASRAALVAVLSGVLRQFVHRGKLLSEHVSMQQSSTGAAAQARSEVVKLRGELLRASKTIASLEHRVEEALVRENDAEAAHRAEVRKVKSTLSSLTSHNHVLRTKLQAKDEELAKVKDKLLRVLEAQAPTSANAASAGLKLSRSLNEKEFDELRAAYKAQSHELRLVRTELSEVQAQATHAAQAEYGTAFEAGFKAGQANDPMRATLQARVSELEAAVTAAASRAAAAESAAAEAADERDALARRVAGLDEALELAKLELEARPKVPQWRAERESAASGAALTRGVAASSGLAFVVARDGNVSGSRTRDLIKHDRESHRLSLGNLDALPGDDARELLRTVVVSLGLPDAASLPDALTKITRAMAALPPLQDFVSRVLDVARAVATDVDPGTVLPLLRQWRDDARNAERLAEFKCAVEDALGVPQLTATQARALLDASRNKAPPASPRVAAELEQMHVFAGAVKRALGLGAGASASECVAAIGASALETPHDLEAHVHVMARLAALFGVETPADVLNAVVALNGKVSTYETALPEYVVLVDSLFDMLGVDTLGDILPALRHMLNN